jgi:hypothetical protein
MVPADDGDRVPIYQSTKILDLLLEASLDTNSAKPIFLILDEMNLSHVERYLADFLSAFESRQDFICIEKVTIRGYHASLAVKLTCQRLCGYPAMFSSSAL